MVKTIKKNLLLWNRWTVFNETWYIALGTLAHHSLYKSRPLVDLDLFYGKLNFGYIGFSMEKKVKTLNFSGSFVACDLKVDRYRQHVKLVKCCEYKRSRSFLDLGQRSFTNEM